METPEDTPEGLCCVVLVWLISADVDVNVDLNGIIVHMKWLLLLRLLSQNCGHGKGDDQKLLFLFEVQSQKRLMEASFDSFPCTI
jgi:hypothetical protein